MQATLNTLQYGASELPYNRLQKLNSTWTVHSNMTDGLLFLRAKVKN